MATNNFKAFALDPNANVTPQADWEALPALLSGFTAGKAASAQVNKALRQSTTIAALVGQFIANSGADALDNADVNGLVTKFTNALIANLGLGT
ncbi:phage tail protein, partial [Enterobacter cloacae subsp. cloacae]|nr:phage tail protein [Enterobacter cloacae subsp. cloacae]